MTKQSKHNAPLKVYQPITCLRHDLDLLQAVYEMLRVHDTAYTERQGETLDVLHRLFPENQSESDLKQTIDRLVLQTIYYPELNRPPGMPSDVTIAQDVFDNALRFINSERNEESDKCLWTLLKSPYLGYTIARTELVEVDSPLFLPRNYVPRLEYRAADPGPPQYPYFPVLFFQELAHKYRRKESILVDSMPIDANQVVDPKNAKYPDRLLIYFNNHPDEQSFKEQIIEDCGFPTRAAFHTARRELDKETGIKFTVMKVKTGNVTKYKLNPEYHKSLA